MTNHSRKFILTVLLVLCCLATLLAGCGNTSPAAGSAVETITPADSSAPTEEPSPTEPEPGITQVSTIDEFLAALAPETTIQLAPGTYQLTQASDYGKPIGGRYYTWESNGYNDDYSLRIQGADGLTLIGGDGVEIVTEPRSVHVLTFRGCNSLTLQRLTVGHTEAAEACEGGVIRLEACENVSLTGCSLYGCGTVGIWTEDVRSLTVSDCEVYHCSSSAYYFYRSSECRITGGSVYDLGGPDDDLGSPDAALAVLYSADSEGISLDGVNIHDNVLASLVGGTEADGLKLSGLSVTNNRITTLFGCGGTAALNHFTMESNTIGGWFASACDSPMLLRLDGELVHEDDLTALWGEQLASTGVGMQEVEPVQPDYSGTAEVHVTTADEFVAALASDTTIYIDVPQLNLTDAAGYPAAASDDDFDWNELTAADFTVTSAFFHTVYDGAELAIGNLQNLHIVSTLEGGAEIVTEPRYAYVLRFYGCDNVTLENITLGHTIEAGYCTGGVLYFEGCSNIVLQGCNLYGCGTYGIEARGCENVYVQFTQIHDCTYGAVWFIGCDSVAFIGSEIRNCPSPQLTLESCFSFTYDGVLMDPSCAFDMDADAVG